MQKKTARTAILLTALGLGATFLLNGCNVSSGDNVVRNVDTDYSGFYTNPNGNVVSSVSGAAITSLDLQQTGDRLQAVAGR